MTAEFKCNNEGYLLDYLSWTPQFAKALASSWIRPLDEFDWEVIEYIRGFYEGHQRMPLTRNIIHYIKQDMDPGFDSVNFQERYTDQPLWVLAKFSGVPKPVQCI